MTTNIRTLEEMREDAASLNLRFTEYSDGTFRVGSTPYRTIERARKAIEHEMLVRCFVLSVDAN